MVKKYRDSSDDLPYIQSTKYRGHRFMVVFKNKKRYADTISTARVLAMRMYKKGSVGYCTIYRYSRAEGYDGESYMAHKVVDEIYYSNRLNRYITYVNGHLRYTIKSNGALDKCIS